MLNLKPNQLKISQILNIWLKFPPDRQQGLSIIEVLMAMLVTATVLSIVSPIFLIATATRVMTFKAQQAMAIAQSEIDRVEVNLSQGVNKNDVTGLIPPEATGTSDITTLAPPTNQTLVRNYQDLDTTKFLEKDIDNDTKPDYLVQLFRDGGEVFGAGSNSPNEFAFFKMGVRVYAINAKDDIGKLDTKMASISFGKGLQEIHKKPLAVVYTDVIRSNSSASMELYRQRLCVKNPSAAGCSPSP